jgi:hypothetical protein
MQNPSQLGPFIPVRDSKRKHDLYTPQHIFRLEREGKIPKLIRRGPRCRAYLGPAHLAAMGFLPDPKAA